MSLDIMDSPENNLLLSELRAWRRAAKKLSRALSRTVAKDPNCDKIRAESMAFFQEVDGKYPRREP